MPATRLSIPLVVLSLSACSDIERPEFGADAGLTQQAAGTTPREPAYKADVRIDIAAGPENGAPRRVSPALFGAAEELGRIGINSDADIRRWVSYSALATLKWGGTAAESFDWEADHYHGLIYASGDGKRPEKPQMGLFEFLDLCADAPVEPIITVSAQMNDPAKAARLVEFLNSPDVSKGMGLERARRGRHEPYGVTLFQIGDDPGGVLPRNRGTRCHYNRPFNTWTPCAPDAASPGDYSFVGGASYASLLPAYAAAMRAAPGGEKIRIIAGGFPSEVAAVEAAGPGTVNYVSAPYYPFTGTADYPSWGTEEHVLDAVHGSAPAPCGICANIEAFDAWFARTTAPLAGTGVALAVGEWNMDGEGRLPIMGTYPAALWAADVLGRMAAAGAGAASFWSIESRGAGYPTPLLGDFGFLLYEDGTGRRVRKALRAVLQFYAIFFLGEYVTSVSSEPSLVTHAAWNPDSPAIAIIAINRERERRVDASLSWAAGRAPTGFARAWSVEEDAPGKPTGTTGPRADRVWCAPDLSRCSLPPHSISVITGN